MLQHQTIYVNVIRILASLADYRNQNAPPPSLDFDSLIQS